MKNRNRKNYSKSSKKKLNIRSKNIKKEHVTDKKRKNFKFIKRSKDAEESQRKQKLIEDTYKHRVQKRQDFESDDGSEVEEVNHYDELLSSLAGAESKNKKSEAIDSDDDDELESDECEEEGGDEEMSEVGSSHEDIEEDDSEPENDDAEEVSD